MYKRQSLDYVENLADADQEIQMEVLRRSIDYWEGDPLGHIDAAGWENMLDVLLEMGLLTEAIPTDQAFTTEFIGE